MYLGAKRRYINTLPFLPYCSHLCSDFVNCHCWHLDGLVSAVEDLIERRNLFVPVDNADVKGMIQLVDQEGMRFVR